MRKIKLLLQRKLIADSPVYPAGITGNCFQERQLREARLAVDLSLWVATACGGVGGLTILSQR